jgi:hypothetical protein
LRGEDFWFIVALQRNADETENGSDVNGGEIPGQRGGVKAGHGRGGCAGMKRGPIGPLFMPVAKIFPVSI